MPRTMGRGFVQPRPMWTQGRSPLLPLPEEDSLAVHLRTSLLAGCPGHNAGALRRYGSIHPWVLFLCDLR